MKLMSHERTISRNYSPNYGSRFSGRPDSLCRSWNLGGDPVSLLENFERYPLTFGPTPIEHLPRLTEADRKSTRLNSSHVKISYAVFCLKKNRAHSLDG